jgi:hypothetical protein
MEELAQVLFQFTNKSLIDSPSDDPRTDLSELADKLPLDSLLEPPEDDADTIEELSELNSEVLSESLLGTATTDLSELTDELPSKSLTQVPEDETKGISEISSKSLPDSLPHGELANRLGVPKSTLSDRKKRTGFSQWSKERDPDGIAWTWNPRAKVFVPAPVADVPKSD